MKRREFLITSIGVAASTLALSGEVFAAIPPVTEADPTAQALGYRADATKIDKTKYPKYVAGQTCSNCNFYQGKSTDASGPCTMFPGKAVAAKGWCSAYMKKT